MVLSHGSSRELLPCGGSAPTTPVVKADADADSERCFFDKAAEPDSDDAYFGDASETAAEGGDFAYEEHMLSSNTCRRLMHDMFKVFDSDDNGSISLAELDA